MHTRVARLLQQSGHGYLSRTSKSMSSPLSSALENHLQQYDSSSDVDYDSASDASGRGRGLSRIHPERQRSVDNLTSQEPSFWSLVFTETSPGRSAFNIKVTFRHSGVCKMYECASFRCLRLCRSPCLKYVCTCLVGARPCSCVHRFEGASLDPVVEPGSFRRPSLTPVIRPPYLLPLGRGQVVATATPDHRTVHPRVWGPSGKLFGPAHATCCTSSWVSLCVLRASSVARPA